ncbi:hypothetical protein [Dietzia sp. 179-F 9C3 NHS]|uniref:hypothetical protein n=1 Tax=Dietzia sp. 179-F 9C3 NHS TaxID=3374295 RepID=UPI00387A58F8
MPPTTEDADTPGAAAGASPAAPVRLLAGLCALVVLAATVLRTWVASAGWFYWDDLLLHGLAARHAWPSPGLLLTDHDGHLMPGGMLLAWLAAHTAPLDFRLPLLQIALLQVLAGVALARMLWVLLRGRPILLAPLVLALVLPLGLPAATWWSSALNALPLTAAMAWAVASTLRYADTGRPRHGVGAVAATAVGLFFGEKAVLVPVVAVAVLVGRQWVRGADLRGIWPATRALWAAQALVVAAWAVLFALAVGRAGGGDVPSDSEGDRPGLWGLIDHSYRLAVGPTLAGGPWRWERWHPGPPMADPGVAAVTAGAFVCAAVLAWSLLTRRRTGPIWAAAAVYPLVSALLVAVGRGGPDTATEIVQTLRYHSDVAVVLAAALALAWTATRRSPAQRNGSRAARWEPAAVAGLVVVLASSSSLSTAAYRDTWAEQPSRDYLEPLVTALHERTAPMLDAEVPPEVLLPLTAPDNRLSAVLAGVDGLPPIGAWTTDPVTIDAHGALHSAAVVPGRTIGQGPEPDCGYRVAGGTRIPLDGPLLGRDWVLQLNLLADADGTVAVRLDEGEEVRVPIRQGLGTVFVRVEGSGEGVTLEPGDGVSELCVGSGPVGVLVPR